MTMPSGFNSSGALSSQGAPASQAYRKSLSFINVSNQKNANSEAHLDGWSSEIKNKINEYPATIQKFLEEIVPSDVPYMPARRLGNPFCALNDGVIMDEIKMYDPLVKGLNRLVSRFHQTRKINFHNSSLKNIKHPYSRCVSSMGENRPDIIASLPGVGLPSLEWHNISLAIEVKSSKHRDPMNSASQSADHDLIALAKDACKLMLAHGALCSFVIGIYGHNARIYRFDHAAAIVSPSFDYRANPDLLRQFLWQFVHQHSGFLGSDDFSRLAEPHEIQRAKRSDPERWNADDEVCNRVVWLNSDGEEYLMLRPRSVHPQIFARASFVAEAIRLSDMGSGRVIVKIAWRQQSRRPETVFYSRIEEYANEAGIEITGLARLVEGRDMGEHGGLHLTGSSAFRRDSGSTFGERSHMCIVLDIVGVPLENFRSTQELTQALRDAIEGHRIALMAGVLHRDISPGNLVIVRDNRVKFKGAITDFDYSNFLNTSDIGGSDPFVKGHKLIESDEKKELKERTGTYAFIALEILMQKMGIIHEAKHDLESFFWTLLWIVLRHTKHNHPEGSDASSSVFPLGREWAAINSKGAWLRLAALEVEGNKPMTHLIARMTKLVNDSVPGFGPCTPLTHKSVLDAFDEALAMDGWPENDAARPFEPAKAHELDKRVQGGYTSSQCIGGQSIRSVGVIKPPSVKLSTRSESSKRSRSYRDDDLETQVDPDERGAKRAKQDELGLEVAAHQEAAGLVEKAPSTGYFEDIAELLEYTSSVSSELGSQYGSEHYEQSQDYDLESLADIPPSSPSSFSTVSDTLYGDDDFTESAEVERLIDAPSS